MWKKIKDILVNIGTSLITVLILLLIVEVVLRFASPQNLSGTWRVFSPQGYMLNKASSTAQHQHNDRTIIYRFNQYHLRGGEVNHEKYKILGLGDSYTFGWLLEEEDTYIQQLQNRCDETYGSDAIEWINGGAGGWGLADFSDYLKEYGDSLNPDLVVVFFNSDDIGRSLNRYKYFSPETEGGWKAALKKSGTFDWFLEHSHLVQWVRIRLANMDGKNKPQSAGDSFIPGTDIVADSASDRRSVEVAEQYFLEIHQWCTDRQLPLQVITTGWHLDLYQDNKKHDPEVVFLADCDSFFIRNQIPYADFTPEIHAQIADSMSSYIIPGDHHPNEKGARLIASHAWKQIQPFLQEHYTKE